MASKKIQQKDKAGDKLYPITLTEAVIDYEGKTVERKFAELEQKIRELEEGGSIDPELLEGFIPLSRDFSDDFNNDFAR